MGSTCDLWSIIKLITVPNNNGGDILQGALKKVVATYGILAVLFLVRVRRRRYENAVPWLRNATSLSVLHAYPLIRYSKLLSSHGRWSHQLAWSIVVASALKLCTRMPASIPSYLIVEVCCQYVMNRGPLRELLQNLEQSRLIRIKQLILCALVPALYFKPIGGQKFFTKSSLIRDFGFFYISWNILSIFQYCRKNIFSGKAYTDKLRKRRVMLPKDEWPLVSTSLKPLMDKLVELQELAISRKSHTILETVMDSPLIKNVGPCLRWAIWRQFCIHVLSQVKLRGTQVMKSLVLMFGFLVLDHNAQMNISPQLLKYLLRYQLKDYLERGSDFKKKWLTFASSNFALYTAQN